MISIRRLQSGAGGGDAVRAAVRRAARERVRRARGADGESTRVAREAGGARLAARAGGRRRAAGLLVRARRVRDRHRRVPPAPAAASRPHLYVNAHSTRIF